MSKGKKPGRPRPEDGIELSDFEGPELGATAELIRELANLSRETGLGEIEIEDKNIRVRLARGTPPMRTVAVSGESHVESAGTGDGRAARSGGRAWAWAWTQERQSGRRRADDRPRPRGGTGLRRRVICRIDYP